MVLDRLRGKKKQTSPEISRRVFLDIKPVRNSALKWERNQQGVIVLSVSLRRPQSRRRKSLFSAPVQEKKIQLDSMGSIVWELCDGKKTVRDIVRFLHEEYKMLPSEAEISLNTYFYHLAKRGFMDFIVPGETRGRLEEAVEKEKNK
jgi:hypothetical protein